jgi:hypothetical protein
MIGYRILILRWCLAPTAILFAACSSPTAPSSPTPATISLQSSAWQTISDPQPYPLGNDGPALTFEFPGEGSMHYLFTPSPLTIVRGTLSISLRVTTSGPVVFNSLDQSSCGIPPSVRPLIWANSNGSGNNDRWWSNPRAFALAAGTATITVPLTAESWSNVNGKYGNADTETRYAFEKALTTVSRFGVTFGGGCSFGHGVNVRAGAALFALTEYVIR